MKKLGHKGFTLIEVIIVIAVMSIMMATAGYYMGNQGNKAQLKSAARDLISNMNLARTRAIRDTTPWAIEFDSGAKSYTVFSDPGEDFAPEDPADPVNWNDNDEIPFRSVTLPKNVSFGSAMDQIDSNPPVVDGISYADNRIIFYPNGTSSESGAVYFSIPADAGLPFDSFAVSTRQATGRVKSQNGCIANGWSH